MRRSLPTMTTGRLTLVIRLSWSLLVWVNSALLFCNSSFRVESSSLLDCNSSLVVSSSSLVLCNSSFGERISALADLNSSSVVSCSSISVCNCSRSRSSSRLVRVPIHGKQFPFPPASAGRRPPALAPRRAQPRPEK
jgi:hypothetical protein